MVGTAAPAVAKSSTTSEICRERASGEPASALAIIANAVAEPAEISHVTHAGAAGAVRAGLGMLDPQLVLQRGYAWLADEAGATVVDAAQVTTGQALRATLAKGQIGLVVKDITVD